MKKFLTLMGTTLLLASLASAAPCTLGADVTSLGTCDFGGLTFSDWGVQVAGGATAIILFGAGSNVGADGTVYVRFQVGTNPSPVPSFTDILLNYSVTGGVIGVDMFLGTHSGSVTITENVCAVAFVQGACPNGQSLLPGGLVVSNQNTINQASLTGSAATIYIQKDIQMQAGSTLSDFTNSHEVPEPMTFLLMGSGLLGLGLLRRRMSGN